MKSLVLALSLVSPLAFATLGGMPSVHSDSVKMHVYVCLDKMGNPIAHTQGLKHAGKCAKTGDMTIDMMNSK